MHHCCSPCVCDTHDKIKADTKTLELANGKTQQLVFAVIGDPCTHPEQLERPFNDPFSGGSTTLTAHAPEVSCDAAGRLRGATFSDHGAVIIGLLSPAPAGALGPPPADPTPGRAITLGGTTFQDSPSRITELEGLIRSEPVLLFGMRHARCTMAASARLEGLGACFRWVDWQQPDDELWTYLKCKHPHEMVGGMEMHSYAYVGGEYAGNGFTLAQTAEADLTRRLSAAGARMDCKEDCDALAPAEERAQLAAMLRQPMALLGWSGCPCTNIARSRFEGVGACYVQTVWPTDDAPLYKHLQCKYGRSHHSFVFAGGAFIGDGFALQESRMGQPEFNRLLDESRARLTCQRKGDENLAGKPLMPCTQSNDGSTTGWARTGSCNWDPSDSGYHEVCVTMSDEFLKASARHDANDLSSVVSAGGHWCICAWAWASAVSRDPTSYEGITLDCDRTNLKLREVYDSHIASGADLRSPSGAAYKAKAALDAVNRVCSGGGNGNTTTAARLFAAGTTTNDATAASAPPAVEAVDGNGRGASAMLAPVGFAALAVIGALFGVRQLRRRPTSTEREQLTPHLAAKRRAHERESPAATDFSDAEAADDKLGFYDSGMECADSAGEDGGGVVRVGATPSTGSLLRGVESDARC